MKASPNRHHMYTNHGAAMTTTSANPTTQRRPSNRRRASADTAIASTNAVPHSAIATGPFVSTASAMRTYPPYCRRGRSHSAATVTSAAPPNTNRLNSVSRMAYRAKAKRPGLADSSSEAITATSIEMRVAPSHAVTPTSASAASAGTKRAANSLTPNTAMAIA